MTQEQQKLFNRLVQSWVKASRLLRIQVRAPLSASHGGRVVEGVAFLPDFGSANGMVIGAAFRPGLVTDDTLETFANRKQMFYASLSLPGYQDYSEEKYKEALNDWGYFGPIGTCPNWFTGYNHTQIGMTHQELVRSWTEASHSLNIRVITDCERFAARCTFVALLPDFGSPAGMVLGAMYPPGFDKDRRIGEFAKGAGMACFFLNGPEYLPFDKEKYKDFLSDRGYFGPEEQRPCWAKQ